MFLLLWAGNDQGIYQKVGRQEKAHLLKQALSTAELEAMPEPAMSAERDGSNWAVTANTHWRGRATDYIKIAWPLLVFLSGLVKLAVL